MDHNKLWKILKDMEIPDHLTCLLINLYAGQEATVRSDREQQTGPKQEKECVKAVYCHPAYLTSMQSTSCKMPGWMKHKLESRLQGEISINSGKWHHPYGRKWRRVSWRKWKRRVKKVGLKLNIQKTKIIVSGPITSWQIDGETMKTVRDFILGAPKSLQMVTVAVKLKDTSSLVEKLWPTWRAYLKAETLLCQERSI